MSRRPSPGNEPVPAVALQQAGVFTRRQALAAGWSPSQVNHRLRTGVWRRFAGRALAAAEQAPWAWSGAWAVHLTWPTAVASHLTAAKAHRMPVPDGPVHAITGPSLRSLHDLVAHRVDCAPDDVVHGRDGRPSVTTARRTVLDCLRILGPEHASTLYAWAVTRELLTRQDLLAAVVDGYGRHGTPALLDVLAGTSTGALSPAERRFHALLRAAGLTGWVANARVPLGSGALAVVDVLFPAERVVVEVDGWVAHSDRDSFERDRQRQNLLVNAGYVVLRFTWSDLQARPDGVLDEVRAALRRAR